MLYVRAPGPAVEVDDERVRLRRVSWWREERILQRVCAEVQGMSGLGGGGVDGHHTEEYGECGA